jgi:hypothetical protein
MTEVRDEESTEPERVYGPAVAVKLYPEDGPSIAVEWLELPPIDDVVTVAERLMSHYPKVAIPRLSRHDMSDGPHIREAGWTHECAEKRGALVLLGGGDCVRCACDVPAVLS